MSGWLVMAFGWERKGWERVVIVPLEIVLPLGEVGGIQMVFFFRVFFSEPVVVCVVV